MLTMRTWLVTIALGTALLSAQPARADVPQQIIDQTANLRVQEVELKHLIIIGKLADQDASAKKQALEAQIRTLWLPYRAATQAEVDSARRAIDGLVADKLSLLRPQWMQEEAAVKAARDQHNNQLRAEAEVDARAAAELQRQRAALQNDLAAGTLTQNAYNEKDKQASDAIAAYRKKYAAAGEQWPAWFDQRYRVALEAALKKPDTPLPQPTVPAAQSAAATVPAPVARQNTPPVAAPVSPTVSAPAVQQNKAPTTAQTLPTASVPVARQSPAPPAQAEVPQQIIDQVADLRVQEEELRHLTAVGKLAGPDAATKQQAIEAQIKALWQPYHAVPAAEDTRAWTAINRLVTDKLSLLQPQWTEEESALKAARDQRDQQLQTEAGDDARRAAELQRQRIALQKDLAGGTLGQDAFNEKDKQASDAIAALRKKYDDAGEEWPRRFDERYRVSLETALKNPDTPLPQPTVAAAPPGAATTPPDFAGDVQTAADLAVKREENGYKFNKNQINQALMAATDAAINTDLARLKARYDALVPKRGDEFLTAYLRAAAPRIQALKTQYYPERYRPTAVSARQDRSATQQTVSPLEKKWITEFVIGIGAFALLTWWLWGGVAKATKNRAPAIRRSAHAVVAVALLVYLSHLFSEFVAAVIGALVLGIWALLRWRDAKAVQRLRRNNQNEMNKFGDTKEERSKGIDVVFDRRTDDLTFDLNERGIRCRLFRSLSAMSPREREVLRTAYHLYNLGLFSNEGTFRLVRFGLIYGDGKAVVTGNIKYPARHNQTEFRSISDALKWYQGEDGPEAMINLTMSWLPANTNKGTDDPVLKKLSSRLHGDGGDLVPGAPLKSGVKGEPIEGSLVLGLDEKRPDIWWYYDGEGSLITIAPPGSGKTQSQVFPNLLMWKGAAVVLDVKGEIYEQTSRWRRENVGPVYKFSPLDPATSHGFNPLAEVRADPDYLWEDARFLADMMIVPSGAKDPFWESRARDVLTAAIARVCLEEDVAKRSMGDVLDVLHGVGWDKFVTYLEARIDFPSMSRAGHSLASMEPKTRDGVLQSALSSMSAWDGERIARAMRKSDWSPLDLRSGKNPTIYICLKPNEVDSYISLLRVFIAQHIRALTSTAVPAHGVHPILFMLDELPRLKHMPPVEEALEIGRQYGIKLWLFAQSLGQLGNAYPNAEGMIGGCAIRMFMNPSLHDETAKKVSDDIGFMDSVVDGTHVKIVEPNVLAGPDYKDLVIVMAANARAARLKKYFAYEDDALKARMGSAAKEPAPVA